jgi:hypothetical protein
MQRCSDDELRYLQYIRMHGLHFVHVLHQICKEVIRQEGKPLSWTALSCAIRRSMPNQNQDLHQGEYCICRENHNSLKHKAAMDMLNAIPELTLPGNNLYIAAMEYLRCIKNRKEFKSLLPNQRYYYLRLHCMNFVPTNMP